MNSKIPLLLLPFLSLSSHADDIVQKLDDITVTSQATSNLFLNEDELHTKMGSTLGETLQNELGVNNQSFGAGVGSPVIRGQAGARVKVMQNSLGNNDASTISPDHAIGIEPINVERIEILRGADTLRYGSGAIGGIVNVIDQLIPEKLSSKLIGGAAEQRFNSASDETSSALKLEGSKNHFAYHVDGFWRDQNNTHIGGNAIDEAAVRQIDTSFANIPAGEIQNSHGVISNSQARSQGGGAGFSWVSDEDFVGASINTLDKMYGIPVNGKGETPVHIQLNETKYNFKGQVAKPFAFAEKVNFKFSYNDYKHVEMEGNEAGATFINKSYESRLTLDHTPFANIAGTVGFQTNHSDFSAFEGENDIVPKTQSQSYALFAVEKLPVGALSYELGGRAEYQHLSPQQRQSLDYVPLSGSAAIAWDMTKTQQWKLGFTHSQRAPQIQELFTDGFHDATFSYEKGNAALKKELSNNLELSYRLQNSWVNANATVFHNWVSDYIYQQRTSELFNAADESFADVCPSDGECFAVLNTQQQAATFKGFEAQAVFPLITNRYGVVDLTLFGDYTRGQFEKGGDVPRMPPLRYGAQFSYEKEDWSSNVRLTRGEAQTNTGENESVTPAYLKLDLGTQYKVADFANTEILLFAKGKNLLNENIRNSVSYLRNFSPEMGRSGEVGVRITY